MKQLVFILFSFLIVSCGSSRRSEPISGRLQLNEYTRRGEMVFMNNCQKCHPEGEGGVGLPLNNVPLPGVLTKFRVRSKAFLLGMGRMPSFKQHEISTEELNALVAYMKVLRKNKKEINASVRQ